MTSQVIRRDSVGKLLILGIQHVFAMFGATVLVPALTGLSPSTALLCAGLGTLLFHFITGRKVPVYLGSSFAFITAIQAVATQYSNGAAVGSVEYFQNGLPYATGGVVVAGALYVVLALLVRVFGADKIRSFFPPVVTGPMIVIIGMMLAPTAVTNITTPIGDLSTNWNWLIAVVTIATIIGITLWAKGIFKLVPILFGIFVGYAFSALLTACGINVVNFTPVREASFFQMPELFLPKFSLGAIVMIAPIAIVTFVEHIGDITANGAVVGKDFVKDPGLDRTLLGDGLATMLAGFLGGPTNTTYGENTGVLAATKNYNPVTLEIAACFAILLAFLGKLDAILQTLPGPVMGAVSVVLFGMIAAVGLRTLVENQVDFKASRNLLIVAVMLVFGLGGASVSFGAVTFSGTALAAVLGIVLNKVLPNPIEK